MPHTCSCGLHEHPSSQKDAGEAADAAAALHAALRSAVRLHPDVNCPAVLQELTETRRAIHAAPELSFREAKTAALVAARLRELPGYEVTEGIAPGHGVMALLRGGAGDGPCVALRADMDALPIHEAASGPAGAPARTCISGNDGVMHACGHDGHTAIMLTVARVLSGKRCALRGHVKLLFQPAEEDADPDLGPYGGAHEMLKAGVLDAPRVDMLYGLHLWSYEPVGTVLVSPGPVMASCDTFHITVTGRGGHGGTPHVTADPVVASAALVGALQTVVSRSTDPLDHCVLTVGTLHAGNGVSPNVIPPDAKMHGTIRAFDAETRATAERRLREICAGIGAAYGCEVTVAYECEAPAVVNAEAHAQRVAAAARRVVGATDGAGAGIDGVRARQCTMAAEDVSFMLNAVPGCFFFVGSAPGGVVVSHHKPEFDIDEASLPVGASVLVHIVEDVLMA